MNRKFLISVFLVMILGVLTARVVYSKTTEKSGNYNTYLLQLGVYNSREELQQDTRNINDVLVIKDNNKFVAIAGLSKNKDNIKKISKLYENMGYSMMILPRKVVSEEFLINLEQFDKLIESSDDLDEIRTINSVILSSYEEMIINKEKI